MKQALILFFAVSLFCCVSAQAGVKATQAPQKTIELKDAASPRMHVFFNHASHKKIECDFCHHAEPSDAASPYVSCGASEECHYIKGRKERDVQSLFPAYHDKKAERSCYGCHRSLAGKHPDFKGCRPCHMSPQAKKEAAKAAK